MANKDANLLHLGVDLDKDFVLGFREYCRLNDFKQKTVVQRLVEFWLALDPIDQEHIYRGRLKEVFVQEAETVVSAAEARAAKKKRSRARNPSKPA